MMTMIGSTTTLTGSMNSRVNRVSRSQLERDKVRVTDWGRVRVVIEYRKNAVLQCDCTVKIK